MLSRSGKQYRTLIAPHIHKYTTVLLPTFAGYPVQGNGVCNGHVKMVQKRKDVVLQHTPQMFVGEPNQFDNLDYGISRATEGVQTIRGALAAWQQ